MTKGKPQGGVNKSNLIRQYLTENPDASPKEVAAALGNGITSQLVSTVKHNVAHGRGEGKTKEAAKGRRRKGGASKGRGREAGGLDVSIELLQCAKSFADQAGGIQKAHAALDMLESLR